MAAGDVAAARAHAAAIAAAPIAAAAMLEGGDGRRQQLPEAAAELRSACSGPSVYKPYPETSLKAEIRIPFACVDYPFPPLRSCVGVVR